MAGTSVPALRTSSGDSTDCLTHRGDASVDKAYCLTHRNKALLQVSQQIADVLEPDVKAHGGPARAPGGGGAERRAVERDRQAFKAAPRRADAEQRQRIDEGMRGGVRHRLEHDAEQPGRSGKIPLPDRVARI